MSRDGRLPFALALFSSGIAGLINQVAWQRAAKIYLGGSEALSSMVVVLVFMLGLGLGAAIYSYLEARVSRPIRFLAMLEASLAGVNTLVALLLSLGLSGTVFAAQQTAMAVGLPLRLIYCILAMAVLIPPCALMGATMPAAAEICQRCLGWKQGRHLGLLFFVNTGGAVIGALTCGALLLPALGQVRTLLLAAALNLAAAALLQAVPQPNLTKDDGDSPPQPPPSTAGWGLSSLEIAGFCLGLLSLGYEMYLFRIAPLSWFPWPSTFSRALSGFLLFWSLGVLASAKVSERVLPSILLTALMVTVVPVIFFYDRYGWHGSQLGLGLLYFIPCFFFGLMYGHLVGRCAVRWGHDVGRFHSLNTLGSCAGIVVGTMAGYEVRPELMGWGIAAGLLGLALFLWAQPGGLATTGWEPALAGVGILALFLTAVNMQTVRPGCREYYGRDGVIEVIGRDLFWDGLWHSSFHPSDDYVGSANWLLAAVPAALHRPETLREGLVVGMGTGITASTLARVDSVVGVDVYDINRRLENVLADFPRETLHATTNPKLHMLWQDGRSGLALNSKCYDVITQQPTYLSQAGSSILLSMEYMSLVSSRLNPDGVYTIYCNDLGRKAQSQVVRQTARQVFPYVISISKGYMIIASKQPLDLDPRAYAQREAGTDGFAQELRLYHERKQKTILDLVDGPEIPWDGLGNLVVTDDRPLVEYPELLPWLAGWR